MLRCLIFLALWPLLAGAAWGQGVAVVPTEGAVLAIVQTPRGSFVETERGTYSVTEGDCEAGVCLNPDVIRGLPQRAPNTALPDGFVGTSQQGDIRKAWYGQPTDRYGHGVLGDAIEGGSLVAEDAEGGILEFTLPESQVFEDITPRIHDLDFDGANEVVTIRASQTGGAAVVVFGIRDGALVEIAASAENGQRNRWLNIAGILPEPDQDRSAIYFIRTPHINGRLNALVVGQNAIEDTDLRMNDFSNHVIGSRVLDLSSFKVGNNPQLFIPSQDRRSLREALGSNQKIALPGRINKSVITLDKSLVTATEDGRLLVIFD